MRYISAILVTAIKSSARPFGLAAAIGSAIAWQFGDAMFHDWAWLKAEYVFGASLAANAIGMIWWAWEKTARLKIVGLDSQDLGGASHRIRIDVKNLSFTTDKFSVHVRVEKDNKPLYFGILGRYSVKTEARELEYVESGRDENHRFELSGGESKTLNLFSLDPSLQQFHPPSYVRSTQFPLEGCRFFVSVNASNHSREYEIVHTRISNKIRLYVRTKFLDQYALEIQESLVSVDPPKKKTRRMRSYGIA